MAGSGGRLVPYVPRLTLHWLLDRPDDTFQQIDGTLVFADLSGFTAMSERLAVIGREGAERLTEVIDSTFAELLAGVYAEGGRLLAFGGDAMVLLFGDDQHAIRATRAASGLRRTLRMIGRHETPRGEVQLRISIGVHSGGFTALLVGGSHRQLLLVGAGVTAVVDAEHAASAGEIIVSAGTAAQLPARCVGPAVGGGHRLVRSPSGRGDRPVDQPPAGAADVAGLAVSRSVREYLRETTGLAEHRVATMAFIQVMGTDEVVATSARGAATALHTVVSVVQRACERFGVTFLGADVDHDAVKLLLIAGAPAAHGDDEERMLLALREVLEADLPLVVRAGAHRGNVYVGDVGPAYRRTFTAMGDTVNLAARLMARADPGTVLATHDVVDRSRTGFALTEIEPFSAKGKRDLVHAVAVSQQARSLGTPTNDVLVGRDPELTVLRIAWEQVAAGSGGAVEIVGEPGIGKTALVETFLRRSEPQRLLRARGDLYSASSAYRVARDLVHAALERDAGDLDADAVLPALADIVATRAPQLRPWIPLFGDVLGVPVQATDEVTELADEHRRERLHLVITDLLDTLLVDPTLFVVEDTHWLDDASSALLTHLVRVAPTHQWLFVTTRRELRIGYVQPAEIGQVMRPAPLDVAAAVLLAESTGDGVPLPPVLMNRLVEQAGGNPLFLRELIAAARDNPDLDVLPDSLDGLLTARLDRLGPRDRDLIRRAAVLGLRFRGSEVGLVVGDETTVPGPSAWARLAEFVTPAAADSDPESFAFTHALLRDAAYAALPFRLRRELHGAVADAWSAPADGIDARDSVDEALLSYHFFAAGRWADAWRTARRSGEAAVSANAPVEAAALLERAVRAVRHLGDQVALAERLEVTLRLARAYERSGLFAAAERTLAGVTASSTDPILKARSLVQQAWLAERQGRLRLGVRRARAAQRLLMPLPAEHPGRGQCLGDALAAEGACAAAAGRYGKSVPALRRAVAVAEESGDLRTLAHAGSILDWSLAMSGDRTVGANLQRSLQIFQELGNLVGQAACLTNLGALAYLRGDWPAAVDYYRQGQAVQLRSGDATGAALGAANIGEVLSDQGHWNAALDCLDEALTTWRSTGDRSGVAFATGLKGRLLARCSRYDEARTELTRAEKLHRDVGAKGDAATVRVWQAECLLLAGEPLAALELLDTGADDGSLTASRVRGTALWLSGEPEVAVRSLHDTYRRAVSEPDDYEQVCIAEVLIAIESDATEQLVETAVRRDSLGIVELSVLPA